MNHFRTIIIAVMILLPAVGAFAIVPGGSVDGVGGIDERTPSIKERTPGQTPSIEEAGIRAVEDLAIPSDLNAEEAVANAPVDIKTQGKPSSGGSVKSEGQKRSSIRMTRAEKKAFRKRVKDNKRSLKDALARAKKEKKEEGSTSNDTELLLLVILAILLPPLAVYLHEDYISINFWLCLILTLIFWLPGIIFALVIILRDY